MSLLRIALLNYSDKPITLSITTGDTVDWSELLPTTKLEDSERVLATQPADKAWDVVLQPGHVYGFSTKQGAKIPEVASIKVVYESGKDPWPKPPPVPPSNFTKDLDYDKRFESFLMAAGGPAAFPDLHITHERGEPSFVIITPVRESHSS